MRRPAERSRDGRRRPSPRLAVRALLPLLLVALVLVPATGQRRRDVLEGLAPQRGERGIAVPGQGGPAGEYTFTRIVYTSPYSPYRTVGGGTWATDFPEADNHFITGIREWAGTNLNISPRPEHLQLTDERLFDYPLIYIVEPGFMELSADEVARLREYVLRGGFIFFDDFWGEYEWEHVQEQMKKVFPEYDAKELPLTHPIFHSYLDIEEIVQVPNIYNAQRGVTSEKGGRVPYYMGLEDKDGRLLAFFARNSDLGDAWEWINDSRYPVHYGLAAYKVGINVVIYAMSH
jgi:hypothetical protein